jgi:hypothetical protein
MSAVSTPFLDVSNCLHGKNALHSGIGWLPFMVGSLRKVRILRSLILFEL